jgi:hypothetical protein
LVGRDVPGGGAAPDPGDAAYDIQNGLLDDDGNVYQRGPTRKLSSNQSRTGRCTGLWEGSFTPGRRTIAMGAGGDVGWMGRATRVAEDVRVRGVDRRHRGAGRRDPVHARRLRDLDVRGLAEDGELLDGHATFTNGSKTVTGAGTAWLANVDAGMLISDARGSSAW